MTQAKYAVFPLSLPVLLLASLTMVVTEAALAGGSSDTIQTRGSRADNLWSLSRPRRISEWSDMEQDYSGDVSRMPGLFENLDAKTESKKDTNSVAQISSEDYSGDVSGMPGLFENLEIGSEDYSGDVSGMPGLFENLDAKTESKKDSNSAASISSDNVENDKAVPFARNARSHSNFAPDRISRTEANENLDKRASKFDRIEHLEMLSFRQFSKRLARIGQSETEDGVNVDRRAGKFGRMEQSLNVKADSNQDLDDDDADYDKRGVNLNYTVVDNLLDNTNQSSDFMRFGRADSNSAAQISPITTESEKAAPFLRNARSLSDFVRIRKSETEDDGNVDKRATGFVRTVESDLSEDLAEDARSLSNE